MLCRLVRCRPTVLCQGGTKKETSTLIRGISVYPNRRGNFLFPVKGILDTCNCTRYHQGLYLGQPSLELILCQETVVIACHMTRGMDDIGYGQPR